MKLVSQSSRMQEIFSRIAPYYDFLNHLLSLGIDLRWRKYAAELIGVGPEATILDVATGTGDFALKIARHTAPGVKIIGIDISEQMLARARQKVRRAGLTRRISFQSAPAEDLPFDDGFFEAAVIGFGVRNLSEPAAGLREIYRVLKPGGRAVILEFSLPQYRVLCFIYRFYLLVVWTNLLAAITARQPLPHFTAKLPGDSTRLNRQVIYTSIGVDDSRTLDSRGWTGSLTCSTRPTTLRGGFIMFELCINNEAAE